MYIDRSTASDRPTPRLPPALTRALALHRACGPTLPAAEAGALDAELSGLRLDIAGMRGLAEAVSGRPLPDAGADGGSLDDLSRSIVELAPRLMAPEARTAVLQALPVKAQAFALAALAMPGDIRRAEAHAAVAAAVPLNARLVMQLLPALEQLSHRAMPQHLYGLQQVVGQALLQSVAPEALAADPLHRLADAQELILGEMLGTAPMPEAWRDLAALYRTAPAVPQLAHFAETLGARLDAHVLALPDAAAANLVRAMQDWPSLPPRAQEGVLRDLAQDLARLTGLPQPQLDFCSFFDTPVEGASGGQIRDGRLDGASILRFNTDGDDPDSGIRAPRMPFRASFANAMEVLLHEFTHCWDEFLSRGPDAEDHAALPAADRARMPLPRPTDDDSQALRRLFSGNRTAYMEPRLGREAYMRQPLEQQAFATQNAVTPRLIAALSRRGAELALRPQPRAAATGPGPV